MSQPAARTRRPAWNRKNPYAAEVLESRRMSGEGSEKDVRHYRFAIGDSGLEYQVGDGLGVRPINDPALVDAIIEALGASGDVEIAGKDADLRTVLSTQVEISVPSTDLLEAMDGRTHDGELEHVLATRDKQALEAWLWGRDVLDVLRMAPLGCLSPDEFVGLLGRLQHRTYSISSSPLSHPGEIHTIVSTVRYRSAERDRGGVCSTYLADRIETGDRVGVFILPNRSFRLPADDATPVIMVGPGTGVAPFRAFLHDRRGRGASGRNWLFFGEQHRASDYHYHEEFEEFLADGTLDRLDLAFSRDQPPAEGVAKDYVQNHMLRHGADLYAWLEEGAQLYVCGDATRMAKDVDTALHRIVGEHGGLSDDAAEDYLSALRKDKRYLRDVY
ncbi:diflavin oxidoreductase [Millisia brevis]|uniref:diflavin oxidoreductase n=1 Tax=Millisia brevis TaxID=264148 RepID=UPI000A9F30C7|nr:FAD-binding protein [Millisia brevis]